METTSTILIVDDQLTMRDSLEGLLSNQGYQLVFAENGPEALNKAAQLTPDVILLDVMMPGMDGFEVCQHFRADSTLGQVPILMLTALNDRESRLQGIKAGADDFISKPFDSLELRLRLKTITKLNRYRRLVMEKAKFEWIVEKINEAFLILNQNGEIVYANPHAHLFLNLPTYTDAPIRETFLEVVSKQFKCEPAEAWTLWLKPTGLSMSRYLARPETSTSQALWLRVDMVEMDTGINEQYLIHLRDVTEIMFLRTEKKPSPKSLLQKLGLHKKTDNKTM
ncbi:MAG: response regulator [Pseudomonadota bacterium]